jgi:hypothetical protein
MNIYIITCNVKYQQNNNKIFISLSLTKRTGNAQSRSKGSSLTKFSALLVNDKTNNQQPIYTCLIKIIIQTHTKKGIVTTIIEQKKNQ